MHYKKYSIASDMWSYGVLMYEIWSVGHKPFENIANNKVRRAWRAIAYKKWLNGATKLLFKSGDAAGRFRLSPPTSSWLPSSSL